MPLAGQRAARARPHGAGRGADADPDTGYEVVVHGQTAAVGGTSAVAPLYAGLFAAFGRKLGFVTPKLWLNQPLQRHRQGDNGFYRARTGPDPCTGLGSPIGTSSRHCFGAGDHSTGRSVCDAQRLGVR